MRPKGERYDCDKEKHEMNAEEKEAMAALDASDDEFDKYEELEDDFLMIANEG